jgi:hypothetical protein
MSLEALDDAFQGGTIDEGTLVLAPGSTKWARLGDAAGLSAPAVDAAAASVAPLAMNVGVASHSHSALSMDDSFGDLDDAQPSWKPKRGRRAVAIAAAVGLLGAIVAGRLAPATSAPSQSDELARAAAAQAAAPLPIEDESAAARSSLLSEEQRLRLLEADKARDAAREAARKKDHPVVTGRPAGAQNKGATPFVSGGSKYDPLNGSL